MIMRPTQNGSRLRPWLARGAAVLLGAGVFALEVPDFGSAPSVPTAEAQYGTSRRVARRTARRTSTRQTAMAQGTYSSMPPGCALGVGGALTCSGGQQYQQQMQGTQVVYVPVQQ